MNTQKSTIFAIVMGVLLGMNTVTSFANHKTTGSNLLIKGTELRFATYVKDELPKFASKSSWTSIEQLVTTYNQSASQLCGISATEKVTFDKAVKQLHKKLNRRDVTAKQWASSLEATTQQVRFIWGFDLDSLTPVFEDVPPPAVLNLATPSAL